MSSELLKEKDIKLYVKRDELIHPKLMGNKWRKLKFNLLKARQQNKKTLLTFGGAYSNHIYAVAAAGRIFGFETVGVIRGERAPKLSPTLQFAESCGMVLHFVTRADYKNKTDPAFILDLQKLFGDFYLVPEGGSNALALQGVAEIADELDIVLPKINYICSACGTGGTLAGLISASTGKSIKILGFPVLKNANWMYQDIRDLLANREPNRANEDLDNWTLMLDYHFGGYAKYNQVLIDYIRRFNTDFAIQLEPIYTAKMFYGLFDLIQNDYFPKNSTIVALHTGGLQGLAGIKEFY